MLKLADIQKKAKTLGIKDYKPVPGWQTIYFGSDHMVTKEKALNCINCHAVNGVIPFRELGYSAKEIKKLTNPDLYFRKMLEKQKEAW